MKKQIVVLVLAAMTVLSLCACGVPANAKCEICGKKATKVLKYEGEKGYTCDDCYDSAKALLDLADAFK